MNNYKAKISSTNKQFDGMDILLSSKAEVQKGVTFRWLEPLKEDANEQERKWYTRVEKLVISGD